MDRDPRICEDIDDNHNNIDLIMYLRYFFQTIRLLFFVINVSYFAGIAWILFSDYMEYFVSRGDADSFIGEFDFYSNGQMKQAAITTYYVITTLSTVGFGDFYPISN